MTKLQHVAEINAGDTIKLTVKKNGTLYFQPKEVIIMHDDNKRNNTENAHGNKERNEPNEENK